ncbi:MAG: fumarylacetoacetate hydrolase family protein [Proteobacteria bacterium]|nr:fumarylacetoacetate hydrolase family protein [Pseudomonadota bacterium]
MGTAIVRFSTSVDAPAWGVKRGEHVHRLALDAPHHRDVMACYFDNRSQFDAAVSDTAIAVEDASFHSPLSEQIQLFAQGLNYADHRSESGLSTNEDAGENLLFMKAASSLCGPNDSILRPAGCELLDYEIELGLVLRTDITHAITVTESELPTYIGGMIICNDVSARDLMFGAPMMQWFRGKSQRTFCPAGPVLYLLDEEDFTQLYAMELRLWMNGELKQHATTDLLIHKPAKTLSEISVFSNMNAGDCILTGTPGGVLVGANRKSALAIILNFTNDDKRRKKFVAAQKSQTQFLQPGDVLQLEIKSLNGTINLGGQKNTIAQA